MSAPRIARGSKGRILLYLGAVLFVGLTVVIIHETQTRIDDLRKSSEKCQQQQESLSAQLQVIFEYKTRLEKSVQQEKADHKKTHDNLSSQLEIEKNKRAREVLDTTNKLASLQQHYKLLQSQVTQLKIDNEKLSKLLKEDAVEISNLQDENQRLDNELNQCKKQLSLCPSKSSVALNVPNFLSPSAASISPSPMNSNIKNQQNVLHQPEEPKASSSSPTGMKSTAKSNVVPVPAPGPEAPKPLAGIFEQLLPAGVVPPAVVPKVQSDDDNNIHKNSLLGKNLEESRQLVKPFQGRFLRQPEPEEDEEQKKAVGAPPPEQQQQQPWRQGNALDEEDARRGGAGGLFQNYKDEDGAAPHWNGVNRHLPEGERHEDLQLEDPDEDEGDDDVDQIDYGNDAVNNKNLPNAKQKAHRKFPLGGKHDSVMVNPK
ncbi:Golgi integral membrane protein 4-like isoform X3 [Cloeon dipterum]|uniref:Golgi integral membrane protein 4-like isoform X3 n=1 Tax=Cloeon dipterum TaxID=197152 RepID=UPI00321FBEAD